MNSTQLQVNHFKIYEDFFQQHELVLSSSYIVSLTGDYMRTHGGIGINQKIPLRTYVGISFGRKGFEIGNISYFDISINEFVVKKIMDLPFHTAIELIELQKLYSHLDIKVEILSECSSALALGHGNSLLLIIALLYVSKEADQNLLYQGTQSLTINDALHNETNVIGKAFQQYMLLKSETNGRPGCSGLNCIFDGYYPIISFRDTDKYWSDNENRLIGNPYGFRLNELWEDLGSQYHPSFDLTIIYPGKPFIVKKVSETFHQDFYFTKAKKELMSKFETTIRQLSKKKEPILVEKLLTSPPSHLSELYSEILCTRNLEIVFLLKEILSTNYSEQTMQRFISIFNKYNITNDVVDSPQSQELIDAMNALRQYLVVSNINAAIFPNDTIVYGGCIIIITPLEIGRKKILEFVGEYKMHTNNERFSLVYVSWIDGVSGTGLKIEQDIVRNKQSSFSTGTKYRLINWDGTTYLRSYQAAIEDKNHDIIINLIKNKIYIQGKICSSKELHSQTTTAEILSKLIEKEGGILTNKELSPSSYSKNKNEMITKVINPLIKIIKERFNKNIIINCNGTVSNYSLEFDLKDIKIGIVKDI